MEGKKREIMEQFFHLAILLHRFSSVSAQPHRGQGKVLKILRENPQISQKELGCLLDMRKQSVGELLRKLERHGFVQRKRSDMDHRIVMITLTESGYTLAGELDKKQQMMDTLLDCLSQEEQQNLSSILNKLSNGVEESMNSMHHHSMFKG